MDTMVKSRLHTATKSRDKVLLKQQALLLDAVGPLTYVLEEAGKETLTVQATVEACQRALAFIGNANMHLNRERPRNAILCMNRDLAEMADDDDTFKMSAPQLFGDGFSRKAKERSKELKCLSQAVSSRGGKASTRSFFRGGRANHAPRGGHSNRGSFNQNGNQFRPYSGNQYKPQFNRRPKDRSRQESAK
eukprot:scpid47736/ scgid26689/ 